MSAAEIAEGLKRGHEVVLTVRTRSGLGWEGDRHGKEKEDASMAAKKLPTGLIAFMLVAALGPLEAQDTTIETELVDAMSFMAFIPDFALITPRE
jgi:hypothetical protein